MRPVLDTLEPGSTALYLTKRRPEAPVKIVRDPGWFCGTWRNVTVTDGTRTWKVGRCLLYPLPAAEKSNT